MQVRREESGKVHMEVGRRGIIHRTLVHKSWHWDTREKSSWDVNMKKEIGNSKAQTREMDVILGDSNLDTWVKRCTMMSVSVTKPE